MDIEASHIVTLLQELGRYDATCRRFAHEARQGEPILKVCQAVIQALVDDKASLRQVVIDVAGKPRE